MKLRDLFRKRADPPDPPLPDSPVPAPTRPPDWPTMRPIQRVINSPDLITAPERFSDSLLSWRNPSRSGTLGHYVTPDAPAGVSDGFVTAAPRGELPAPKQPWWWPQPPAVQRHVSMPTQAPEAEPDSVEERAPALPPAVPVYPPTEQALVSAAGAEVTQPRLVLPAVQRRVAEPDVTQEPVADSDLPTGESPPEAPLPSVVAAQAQLLPEPPAGSAVSWPGSRPELPTARRFGLGAPLQRVPDAAGEPSTDAVTVQRRVEIEVDPGPPDVAPLVSSSPPIASVEASPAPSGAVEKVDVPSKPDSGPVWSPSVETTVATSLPTATAPAGAEPFTVQRRAEDEAASVNVVPLVSGSAPMASVGVPSADPVGGAGSAGPHPSPVSIQRAADTPLVPGPGPVGLPSVESGVPAAAGPAEAGPFAVQRRVEDEAAPMEVAPLVSDAAPMASVVVPSALTPSTDPVEGSGSTGPGPSTGSVQRAVDTPLHLGPRPVGSSPVEATATPVAGEGAGAGAADPAGGGPPTVQRRVEAGAEPVKPMEVARLVSESAPMASEVVPPTERTSSEPGVRSGSAEERPSPGFVQRAVDSARPPGPGPVRLPSIEATTATTVPAVADPPGFEPSTVQRRAEAEVAPREPVEVAPLVSDSPPMASVTPPAAMPSAEPVTRPGSAGPSPLLGFVQRAVDTILQRGQRPVWSPSAEPTAAMPMPATAAPVGAAPSAVPEVELREVAPLVSDSEPMGSVVIPAQASSSPVSSTRSTDDGFAIQRSADTALPMAELPLADMDHPVVGLVSDRPIEPAVPGYRAAVESAGGSAAPAVSVEGRAAAAHVSGPRVPATTAVQRSVGAGASPAPRWQLDAPAVHRSFPALQRPASPAQPVQFVEFTTAAPIAVESNPPQLSTEVSVQRVTGDEPSAATDPAATDPAATNPVDTDPAAATGAPAATGAAAGAMPGQPAGSTSPTEIDKLVRRLYDPIVRRLKAELQLDRERAGRTLDLWH